LRDLEYWVIAESGTQTKEIDEPEQLRQILVDELGIQVTEEEVHRLYVGLDT